MTVSSWNCFAAIWTIFSPAEGTPIVEAQQLTAQTADGGLELVYTDASGRIQQAYINLRSEVDDRAQQQIGAFGD